MSGDSLDLPNKHQRPLQSAERVTRDIRACRSYIYAALVAEMEKRHESDDWIENERMAVAVAAGRWAWAHGYDRQVTVDDVERIEGNAVGHIDYATKLALYIAEFVIAPAAWQLAPVDGSDVTDG